MYFKKVEIVGSIQFVNANFEAIEAFVGGDAEFREGKLLVASPSGPLWAKEGEWIVKDSDGDFFTYSSEEYGKMRGFATGGIVNAVEGAKA